MHWPKFFEETFEDTPWRKVKQMQPMWLCIIPCKPFEGPYEKTQRRKVKHIILLIWHVNMTRISPINFTFIFFFFAILHLNVPSLKITATGDKPFNSLAMEQNHVHDKSLEKKLIARVANEQGEKSNKCNFCYYASTSFSALVQVVGPDPGFKHLAGPVSPS